MELTNNTKTTSYPQSESSSETHRSNNNNTKTNKNKSLSLIHYHRHQPMVVSYKECLKNHAASLGGHALDGCGEFMPSPTANSTDSVSLECAACGCHRNFHRRDPYDGPAFIHHKLPPPPSSSPSPTHSPSLSPTHTPPSPVPYSYYSSAPHMLLALSTGHSGPLDEYNHHLNHSNPRACMTDNSNNTSGKKRSRTKFSKEQKEKMHALAERLGWRMPKGEDERLVKEFCNEVGVHREVFKVWMHNNKNNFCKKEMLKVGNLNLDSGNNNEDINENGNENGNGNAAGINNNEYCIQLRVSSAS